VAILLPIEGQAEPNNAPDTLPSEFALIPEDAQLFVICDEDKMPQ
jgi:hypothetical protein